MKQCEVVGFRIVIESLRSGLVPIARSRSFLCPDEVGHRPCPRHGFIKPNRVWMLLVLTPLLVEYVNALRSTVWWYVYSTYVRRRRHVNYVCTYNSAICRRMHTHTHWYLSLVDSILPPLFVRFQSQSARLPPAHHQQSQHDNTTPRWTT